LRSESDQESVSKEITPHGNDSERRQAMYAPIRRLKVKPGLIDEVVQRIENGFVPIISSVPGFVEYVGVQVGEDVALTISLFETQEQVEESTRRAAEWIKQNMAPFAAGPHEIVAVGEVRFRKAK